MAMGVTTIAGWLYFVEDPNLKWMMTGGTPMTMETPTLVSVRMHSIAMRIKSVHWQMNPLDSLHRNAVKNQGS